MVSKIAVQVLCALVLIEARLDPYCRPGEPYGSCTVSPSSATDETWYQEQAILKVVDGYFTAELEQKHSTPRSLVAEGRRITELSRDFARIPSLERLSLEDNLIEGIYSSVFEGLPRLVHLSLARNRINYLEEDSFKGLGKLEILNLNHNSLSVLGNSINDHVLPALTRLYLQHNQLVGDFQSCHSNLRHLYLSDNSIRDFPRGDQPPCLNNLTHLFLENNGIYNLDVVNIPLKVLSLDGNKLDRIPTINPELKSLSLGRNQISDYQNLRSAGNLVSLILSYNFNNYFNGNENTFKDLHSIEHLILDHNSLTAESLPLNLFRNLTSLRSLDLTGNTINTDVLLKQFADLPNLEKLYLGDNHLTSFPGDESFAESRLRYLDLSNNNITEISRLRLNMIPELEVLRLTGNPLRHSGPNSVPKQLTILY